MVKKRNQYGYLFILFTLNPKGGEQNEKQKKYYWSVKDNGRFKNKHTNKANRGYRNQKINGI